MKDIDGALVDFAEAIRLNNACAEAYSDRGIVKAEAKDLKGAIADCDHAVKLSPDNAVFWYNLGNAWASNQNFIEAIKDLDRAIALKPDFAAAFIQRSGAKRQLHDSKGAIADAIQGLQISIADDSRALNQTQ